MAVVEKSIYSNIADSLIQTDQALAGSFAPRKKTTPFLDYQSQQTKVETSPEQPPETDTNIFKKAINWATSGIGTPKATDETTPVPFDEFKLGYWRSSNAPKVLFVNRGFLTPQEETEVKRIEPEWLNKAKQAYDAQYGQGTSTKATLRAVPKKLGEITQFGIGAGNIASKLLEPSQGAGTINPMDIAFGALDAAAGAGLAARPIAKGAQILAKEAKPLLRELATNEVGAIGRDVRSFRNLPEPEQLYQVREEMEALSAAIQDNKAKDLTELIEWRAFEKGGAHANKGEIGTITLDQYRKFAGKRVPQENAFASNGRLKWEYVLDDFASERGYSGAQDLKDAIELAATQKQELKALAQEEKMLSAAIKSTPEPSKLDITIKALREDYPDASDEDLLTIAKGIVKETPETEMAASTSVQPDMFGKPAQVKMFEEANTAVGQGGVKQPLIENPIANKPLEGQTELPSSNIPDSNIPQSNIVPPAGTVPPAGGAVPPPVQPPVPPAGKAPSSGLLGDLQDTDELVTTMAHPDVYKKIANLPGVRKFMSVFNPAGVAKTSAEKAVVARGALREEGSNKAISAFSTLETMGTREQVWGKLDDTLTLTEGKLKGKPLDEVLTYRNKYANDLTPQQAEWARKYHDLEAAKLELLERNDIPVNELTFEEGGEYVGRRVAGRIDPQTGELTESAFIGAPGPGRPGAHMGAEKTRYFKDINEAIEQGFRYLPPDEALYLNLKGAYNRIADKQMADWILDRVAWRGTGAPKELVEAAVSAKNKLNKSQALLAALNRGLRGERGVPEQIVNSIAKDFPTEAGTLKTLLADIRAGKPTGDAVKQFENSTKQLISNSKAQYWQAVNARSQAREMAMKTHFDEASVQAPAFAGKIFTGPEAKEIADVLTKSFASSYGDIDRIITGVNKLNSIGRYFALAGDASPFMIQLITFPFRFPKQYGLAIKEFSKALFSTSSQAKYLAKNNDIVQKSRNLILSKGGQTEYTEAFRNGGIMQSKIAKYPKAVLEPFQRAFEAAIDTAGVELRKAFNYKCTTPQATAEIEQFINEIRGVTSSARIGVSHSVRAAETAAILAPRYNRAIFALVSDIANGGLRGSEARKALAALIAGGTATATGITLARGEGWEGVKDHLDITNSSQFLTWDVAGQKVGPGSKIRSLMVLLGKIIKDPNMTVDHAKNFLRSNLSPVASTAVDVVGGKDYIGEPTRPGKNVGFVEGSLALTKRVIADNLLPIWLQSTVLDGGDIEERATRGASEFFGGRSYPVETSRLWAEKWAKDLETYNAIPTYNSVELKAAQAKDRTVVSRATYRKNKPEIEAKLFIAGQVSTVSTPQAANYVRNLIETNKIDPMDIEGIVSHIEDTTTSETETDKLIKSLGLRKNTTPTSSSTPSSSTLETNTQKWSAIKSAGGTQALQSFATVWYDNGQLTPAQDSAMRALFKKYPLGETNYDTWLKRTVRQIYENEYARIND